MTLDMPWHRVHIENFVHYIILSLLLFLLLTVGYTMTDIRYKWNDGLNSVQISSDVSLPQFKVLGHRQKIIEAELSTGKLFALPFHSINLGFKMLKFFRQLLSFVLRDPVRALDGLLPHPDLYPLQSHRHHILGLILAQPGCHTS